MMESMARGGGMPGMPGMPGMGGKRAKARQQAPQKRTKRGSGNPAKRAAQRAAVGESAAGGPARGRGRCVRVRTCDRQGRGRPAVERSSCPRSSRTCCSGLTHPHF